MERFDNRACKMESFQHLDDYHDNFALFRDVESDLLYGTRNEDVQPWLSVIVPTYRRDQLLREALESILSQRTPDFVWELLVMDNTPLDEAGETAALRVVRELGDKRVCLFHNRENLSIGYNWNRGVELARGEWVCFLHDDDVLFPDALWHLGRQISNYRGKIPLGYLHARRQDFQILVEQPSLRRYPQERLTRFGMTLSGCTGAGSPTCGTTIRKAAYMAVGGINYDFGSSADAVLVYQIMRDYAVVCSKYVLGGARWDKNETLHIDTLLQLIQTDEAISEYLYQQSRFGRWWGKYFAAASTWRNIYRKQNYAKRNHIAVGVEDYCAVTAYSEPKKCIQALFLCVYALYRAIRFVDGQLH